MKKIRFLFILTSIFFSTSSYADVCDRKGFFLEMLTKGEPNFYQVGPNQYIRGNLTEIKLSDDYSIRVIASDGDFHAFDTDHALPKRIDQATAEVKNAAYSQRKAMVEIDRKKARKLICAQYAAPSKNKIFIENRRALERSLGRRKPTLMSTQCLRSWLTFAGLYTAYIPAADYRNYEHKHNWVLDHGDNFYLTIPLMASFNSCVYSSFQGTLATGLFLNVAEEVSIAGHSMSPVTTRARTDWKDLGAGMGAVATYAAWSVLSEKFLSFQFEKECR